MLLSFYLRIIYIIKTKLSIMKGATTNLIIMPMCENKDLYLRRECMFDMYTCYKHHAFHTWLITLNRVAVLRKRCDVHK
jgi:hypothetical protein